MAEKKAAAKKPAAKTAAVKPTAAKAAPAAAAPAAKVTAAKAAQTKGAPAKPAAAKAAAEPKAERRAVPVKRVVARPVSRAVARRPVPRPLQSRPEPRPKAEPRPLPTASAGHAPIVGADGTASGSLELPAALTGVTRDDAIVVQAFLAERANARQANAATKNRARVKGGGAKPWRQKGTGRARQGSTRSPQWRHGGVVFGPNGRRYWQRIPVRMRRAAFAQVFAKRAADGRVLVFDALPGDGERLRTRTVVDWLGRLGDTGRAVLVTSQLDERVGRAVANVQEVELRTPGTLQLTDLLRAETVIVARGALDALASRAGEAAQREALARAVARTP